MGSKIETELLKAAGDKAVQKDGETAAKYRARLARLVSDLPDADWKKISEKAQGWVNEAGTAINKKKDIPEFPDLKPEKAAEKAAPKDEDEDEKPAVKTKPAAKDDDEDEKPTKAPAKPEKAPEKEKADKPVGKKGGTALYRRLLVENPEATKADLLKMVNDKGFDLKASTAEITYYEAKAVLAILTELKLLRTPKKEA